MVPSGAVVEVLLEMEEREGSEEDLRDLVSLPTCPPGAQKVVHMPLFHVATSSCHPSRRSMSSSYTIPIPMSKLVGSMVGPMRKLDMGILSSSYVGQGDPRSNHGDVGSTLDMQKLEEEG